VDLITSSRRGLSRSSRRLWWRWSISRPRIRPRWRNCGRGRDWQAIVPTAPAHRAIWLQAYERLSKAARCERDETCSQPPINWPRELEGLPQLPCCRCRQRRRARIYAQNDCLYRHSHLAQKVRVEKSFWEKMQRIMLGLPRLRCCGPNCLWAATWDRRTGVSSKGRSKCLSF
jgi:hypothetical protein